MTKRIAWNEALAAFDRDLDVLETIRADYILFSAQTVADVVNRVKGLSGGRIVPRIWAAEEKYSDLDCIAEWRPDAPRSIGGLVVHSYSSAGAGGAPGSFTIELWLDAEAAVPIELGAVDLRSALLDATASLPGDPYDPNKHPIITSAEVVPLRFMTVEIAAVDLVDQIASAFLTFCQSANRLTDEIILLPRATDAYRCARLQLLEITTSRRTELGSFEGKWDPKEAKLDEWETGRFLGIDRKRGDGGMDNLWVTAMPSGDVVFNAYGPLTSEKARWKKLVAFARGDERTVKKCPGAVLLDSSAVRAMAQAGKAHELGDLVMDLFRAFLAG